MWRYLKSKEFLLTMLGIAVFVTLLYVVFFFVFLPSYTKHGETVIVPEVTEIDIADAQSKLGDLGLQYEVQESIYIAGLPANAVISQDPTGMSKVKPGRRIYLVTNKAIPPMVRVPEIYGVSQYQAKLRLEGANLNIRRMEYVPHEYKNLVINAFYEGKRLKVGDTLPKFSKIVLHVGRGKGTQNIEVPNLVGEHYEVAIAMLHRSGLNIGVIRFDPKAEEEKGLIITQYPRFFPGDSIRLGSQVDMIIAGPEPEESIEDMIFDSKADTTTTLEDIQSKMGTSRESTTRTAPEREVRIEPTDSL